MLFPFFLSYYFFLEFKFNSSLSFSVLNMVVYCNYM